SLEHPQIGELRVVGPPVKLDGDGFVPGRPTAPLGADTVEILGEIGFDSVATQGLLEAGITRE
nr:CoA transferase [Gammaproteobacteria bacterium]